VSKEGVFGRLEITEIVVRGDQMGRLVRGAVGLIRHAEHSASHWRAGMRPTHPERPGNWTANHGSADVE
jgi:hypothetical protein